MTKYSKFYDLLIIFGLLSTLCINITVTIFIYQQLDNEPNLCGSINSGLISGLDAYGGNVVPPEFVFSRKDAFNSICKISRLEKVEVVCIDAVFKSSDVNNNTLPPIVPCIFTSLALNFIILIAKLHFYFTDESE